MTKVGWEIREVDSLSCVVMPIFEYSGLVWHGVTTKATGNFASNNQSEELRKRLTALFEINPERMVFAQQVHGDKIYVVKESDIKQNPISHTDGLITNIPGICLVIKVADCVPIFILDTKNKALGMVHAGWRGIVKCVVQKAILKMIALYSCRTKDLLVGFGPSIGVCCYKVGNEVVSQFKKTFSYGEELIKDGYLDLQKANKIQLLELGILEENIILNQYCTYHDNNLFFSHRRGDKGRMVSLLQLRK
ncbi:MAG: peptidoglycan editing factor PgeF [bacterium]